RRIPRRRRGHCARAHSSGLHAPARRRACRSPALGRRDRGHASRGLPMSCSTGYRKPMSKDTQRKTPLWRRLLGQGAHDASTAPPSSTDGFADDEAKGDAPQRAEMKAEAPSEAPAPVSWWQRLKKGLLRTSSGLSTSVTELFTKRKLDAETLEDFEDALLRA